MANIAGDAAAIQRIDNQVRDVCYSVDVTIGVARDVALSFTKEAGAAKKVFDVIPKSSKAVNALQTIPALKGTLEPVASFIGPAAPVFQTAGGCLSTLEFFSNFVDPDKWQNAWRESKVKFVGLVILLGPQSLGVVKFTVESCKCFGSKSLAQLTVSIGSWGFVKSAGGFIPFINLVSAPLALIGSSCMLYSSAMSLYHKSFALHAANGRLKTFAQTANNYGHHRQLFDQKVQRLQAKYQVMRTHNITSFAQIDLKLAEGALTSQDVAQLNNIKRHGEDKLAKGLYKLAQYEAAQQALNTYTTPLTTVICKTEMVWQGNKKVAQTYVESDDVRLIRQVRDKAERKLKDQRFNQACGVVKAVSGVVSNGIKVTSGIIGLSATIASFAVPGGVVVLTIAAPTAEAVSALAGLADAAVGFGVKALCKPSEKEALIAIAPFAAPAA